MPLSNDYMTRLALVENDIKELRRQREDDLEQLEKDRKMLKSINEEFISFKAYFVAFGVFATFVMPILQRWALNNWK